MFFSANKCREIHIKHRIVDTWQSRRFLNQFLQNAIEKKSILELDFLSYKMVLRIFKCIIVFINIIILNVGPILNQH